MPSLPDLDSLRCFAAAAELSNFRAASKRVALSPAAFSDRIQQLEALLGARLFERSARGVALTPAGLRLVEPAQRALAAAADCLDVAGDARPVPFELRVATRFELGLSWLVPALDALEVDRPERTLHLYFADTADQLHRLSTGEVDAVVTSARLATAGLVAELLHEERYVFVARPGRPGARDVFGPETSSAHTLVDVHPDLPLFRYFLDARAPSEAWRFGRTLCLGAIGAVRARVLAGGGVAVLPRYFVAEDLARGDLVPLCAETTPRSDHFRLVWRARHPLDRELRALAVALRAWPLR